MATERILNEKKAAVSALAEKLKASNAVVLVDYRGIDVADDTALHDLIEEIKGTISVAISEDEIAPCKILHKYADQFTDMFNVKAGFIDGQKVDTAIIRNLSKLPGREGMVAMVAGSLNSIIASLARGLDEVRKIRETA